MNYLLSEISYIIGAKIKQKKLQNIFISQLILDSRNFNLSINSIFFALKTQSNDGHRYIEEVYSKNIRAFVVSDSWNFKQHYTDAIFLFVKDPLLALQKLAKNYRKKFKLKCIAITGSKGKTIIKEWLNYVLEDKYIIVRSPKSYNSQIGVPLSIFQICVEHEIGIFEVGISQIGEMDKLRNIISPEIGILTNIGHEHSENFSSKRIHIIEKIKLFFGCKHLICSSDDINLYNIINNIPDLIHVKKHYWGYSNIADLQIQKIEIINGGSIIQAIYYKKLKKIKIPFSDKISIENTLTLWLTLLVLGLNDEIIKIKLENLPIVKIRLEVLRGLNHCLIINDNYRSDFYSIKIGLNFIFQQKNPKKTLIISDILQPTYNSLKKYKLIFTWAISAGINRIIAIGKDFFYYKNFCKIPFYTFFNVDDLIIKIKKIKFCNEVILLINNNFFPFNAILNHLENKYHQTTYEINLKSLIYNLNYFRSLINLNNKIMVMVKSFSYGNGNYQIANVLEHHKVDYLGVAYIDEGILLRNKGIKLPILVMNPICENFSIMIQYNLEPGVYNFHILNKLLSVIKKIKNIKSYPIHIKIDTGMHRLGFLESEIIHLGNFLKKNQQLYVKSIFSHLAASEDKKEINFTLNQINIFNRMYSSLISFLCYFPMRHILNSSGIICFPQAQYEMVRLGLGIYGISPYKNIQKKLKIVGVLKTLITQIKILFSGSTVGYGRKFRVKKLTRIAIIPIGYADGIDRRLGYGNGYVIINSYKAPIIGEVCMDMLMIDITKINCKEGDQVIIWGENPRIEEVAKISKTIPYEILTSVSCRVKRIYYEE